MTTTHLIRSLAVVGSALAGLVLTATAPVHAELTHLQAAGDPSGDVLGLSGSSAAAGHAAPARRLGDLTRVRVFHGPKRVTVTLTARRLERPTAGSFALLATPLRTPSGDYFGGVMLGSRPAHDVAWIEGESTGDLTCPGLRYRLLPAESKVRVSIPRSCLKRPRWVRASGYVMYPGSSRSTDMYVDMLGSDPTAESFGAWTRRAWH